MQKKLRRHRKVPPSPPKMLTPTTKLKVGESFVVLRRSSSGESGERCIATIVDIREENSVFATYTESDGYDDDVWTVCQALLDKVCKEFDRNEKSEVNSSQPKRYMYYVHYDGLDKRLDEWIERERIIERAKTVAAARSVLVVPPSLANTIPESGTMTRSQRRIHEEFHHVQKTFDDLDATTAKLEKEYAEMTKIKNIDSIRFGNYIIPAWYVSPYPAEFGNLRLLYICEYCLAYMRTDKEYASHMLYYCDHRQPPGNEIYKSDNIAVYEVDGEVDKAYCQCLCLLSKLFLDHKTLYFDVETFLFYVLCEVDEDGSHVVGHFSKERLSSNNLACIMILPPFQRRGYGKLLIQLSYELSSREGVIGTPEKPLSDLGKVSFRSYWWWVILRVLDRLDMGDITVSDLSRASGLAEDDIISTLQTMQLIKYWKGDHVVRITRGLVEYCRAHKIGSQPSLLLNAERLNWWPKPCKNFYEKDSKSL